MKELLDQLIGLNVKLTLDGDQLKIVAPQGVLTGKLRQQIKTRKQDLIALLSDEARKNESPEVLTDPDRHFDPFPLTPVQHAYWIGRHAGVELGNVATHLYFELSCQELDIDTFASALHVLIDRHDMLRAVIDSDGQQRILQSVPSYEIAVADMRQSLKNESDATVSAIRDEMSHQVRPTDRWPLFEIRLSLLPDGESRLHFSWDFLIVDAWSLYLLFGEWHRLYQNPSLDLAPISFSFRDYVLNEQSLGESTRYRKARRYWESRLDSLPEAPMLPVKAAPSSASQHLFTRRRAVLEKNRWEALKAIGIARGVTPSNVLMAAFAEVLALWSRRPHFTLNLTLFNRQPLHPDVGNLVGDFTTLSLLEVRHDTTAGFVERALALQQQFLRDLEHKEYSGVEVLRAWAKRRQKGMTAAMPVVFTSGLVQTSKGGQDAGVLTHFGNMTYGISQTPQVWLDHQVMEENGNLVFNWDAVEEILPGPVLDAMFEAYCKLLDRLIDEPESWIQRRIVNLPVGQASQREAVNDTSAELSDELLHSGFLRQVELRADAIAVATPSNRLTYAQLLDEATVLARRLCQVVTVPHQLVAVALEKDWKQVAAVLGVLMAGCVYLPVDPSLPSLRRRQLLSQGDVTVVITDLMLEQTLDWPSGVETLAVDGPVGELPQLQPPADCASTDLAYVIFTSGSTGIPKGVMIDHKGAVNTIRCINRMLALNADDALLGVSSLSFDLSVYDIFGVLAVGGTIVLPEPRTLADPACWLAMMEKHRVTVWNSAPQLMDMLCHALDGVAKAVDVPLRAVLLSGDWIPVSLPDRIRSHFGRPRVISLGGATEASIWSIAYEIEEVDPAWSCIPYGKPLDNQTIEVLNEALEPCPVGVVGDLYIGGVGLAKGYMADPEKTAQKFITHPETGTRLYATGDLGSYLEDGNVSFHGREDNQVKVNGYRIELGEVAAVIQAHPSIAQAVVVADRGLDGTGSTSLHAHVVLEQPVEDCTDAKNALVWNDLVEETRRRFPDVDQAAVNPRITALWEQLDLLHLEAVLNAFAKLDLFQHAELLTVDKIVTRANIAPRYRAWVTRALRVLCASGLLQEGGGGCFSASQSLRGGDIAAIARRATAALQDALEFTEREAQWLRTMAESLPELLTERKHSAETYAADELPMMYQKMFPGAHEQLRYAVDAVCSVSRQRNIDVLELGAGLGSATQHVLPVLAGRARVYDFTDISQFFFATAREKFADYAFVRYRHLDLEHSPIQQGFTPHGYDLIVASSVLHALSSIDRTLRHVQELLRPGGVLIFLEETRFASSFDLHMGLQQGFDSFTDRALRAEHPLLSRAQWYEQLKRIGFATSFVVGESDPLSEFLGFDVIVAQGPATTADLDAKALDEHMAAHLPAYMKPATYRVHSELPVTENGKIDYQALRTKGKIQVRAQTHLAPRDEVEAAVLEIWSELLGTTDISIDGNFFDIGGDSLLMVQAARALQQRFNKEITTTTLFEYTTIAEIAAYLRDSQEDTRIVAVDVDRVERQRQAAVKNRKTMRHRENERADQ